MVYGPFLPFRALSEFLVILFSKAVTLLISISSAVNKRREEPAGKPQNRENNLQRSQSPGTSNYKIRPLKETPQGQHTYPSKGKGKQKQKQKSENNRGYPRTPRMEHTRPRYQEREFSQDRGVGRSRSRSPRRPQIDYMGNYQEPAYRPNSEYYSYNRYEPLYYEERYNWRDRDEERADWRERDHPAPPMRTPISSKP